MKRTAAFALALTALFLLCIIVHSLVENPHETFSCSTCHRTDPSGAVIPHQLVSPVTDLCERCHRKVLSEGYSHPVDVRPRAANIPADLPLSGRGELTCCTCHDVHAASETVFGTPSYCLRRPEPGKAFCEACHPAALRGPSGGHSALLGESHFRSRYIATDPSRSIDPMSKNCISCHDGSFASSATFIMAGAWTHGRDFLRNDRGTHPIGVDYETARLEPGRKTDLRPLDLVDRRIRFFDGKVGCGSCHDPYSRIEKMLVMSDRNSRLCLACHLIG